MATDALTITLPGPLADEVRAAAQARGVSPEAYVRQQLALDIALGGEDEDLSWEEDERRLSEPGEGVPLAVAMDNFRAAIIEERKARK